ncbi:MAG: large-conductance mechanosensitive channel protein MscL [Vicinamibacterales bacterium]
MAAGLPGGRPPARPIRLIVCDGGLPRGDRASRVSPRRIGRQPVPAASGREILAPVARELTRRAAHRRPAMGFRPVEARMLKEFREFAMRGNVVDMAVGIIIGGAFGAIVSSFVGDVMMPALGLMLGGTDFSDLFLVLKEGAAAPAPYASLAAAKDAGAVILAYGTFVNTIVNFVIVAFALFLLIRGMNAAKRKEEAAPAPPPAPSNEEKLLIEIRDLLARR